MTEDITPEVELSEKDEIDLKLMEAVDQPLDTTVLNVWVQVLSNIEEQEKERILPGYSQNLVQRWPFMTYQDVPTYWALFHGYLKVYREHLTEIVRRHPEALENYGKEAGDPESDAIANRDIYVELMFQWNLTTAKLEAEWDASTADSHCRIAAMAEAQAFVTGGTGIMQALVQPQVGFEWRDSDQQELEERINKAVEEL